MNSNEKILRLQKASHVVSIVLTVIRVLLVLAALGVILAGIFCGAAFTEELNGLFSAVAQDALTTGVLILLIVCVVAKLALYFAVLTIAGRMFRDFSREDSPFRQIHIRRMRWIALLIWCVSAVFDYGCQLQQESDETL